MKIRLITQPAATVATLAFLALCALLFLTAQAFAAPVETGWIEATNNVATNYFLGSVGIGTNNPQSKLHVVGDATVSGAMTIPRQGDVGMGSYTNGASAAGATPGVLPAGAEGNLLYHNGAQWAALTNLYFDDGTDRLYLGPGTNGAYFDTGAGELHMDGNAIGDLDDPTDAQDAATKSYVDDNYYPGTSAFSVVKTQSVASGSFTKINLDTEDFDLGGDFDASTNYRFTAPATGYYLFSLYVRAVQLNDQKKVACKLVLNGATDYPTGFVPEANSSKSTMLPSAGGTVIVSLSQNDTVELQGYHNHGSDLDLSCRLSGMRIK